MEIPPGFTSKPPWKNRIRVWKTVGTLTLKPTYVSGECHSFPTVINRLSLIDPKQSSEPFTYSFHCIALLLHSFVQFFTILYSCTIYNKTFNYIMENCVLATVSNCGSTVVSHGGSTVYSIWDNFASPPGEKPGMFPVIVQVSQNSHFVKYRQKLSDFNDKSMRIS